MGEPNLQATSCFACGFPCPLRKFGKSISLSIGLHSTSPASSITDSPSFDLMLRHNKQKSLNEKTLNNIETTQKHLLKSFMKSLAKWDAHLAPFSRGLSVLSCWTFRLLWDSSRKNIYCHPTDKRCRAAGTVSPAFRRRRECGCAYIYIVCR